MRDLSYVSNVEQFATSLVFAASFSNLVLLRLILFSTPTITFFARKVGNLPLWPACLHWTSNCLWCRPYICVMKLNYCGEFPNAHVLPPWLNEQSFVLESSTDSVLASSDGVTSIVLLRFIRRLRGREENHQSPFHEPVLYNRPPPHPGVI